MSRQYTDICDRCKQVTDYSKIKKIYRNNPIVDVEDNWDLCPPCWKAFLNFMAVKNEVSYD